MLPEEVKESGSRLEEPGGRLRAQSLSSINILISPCSSSSSLRPPQSPAHMDASLDKVPVEAAASFPLLASSSATSSSLALHRKSLGSVLPSPAYQEAKSAISSSTASRLSDPRLQPSAEEKPETRSSSRHSNNPEEQFLVGEDQMYPTLRSKSWSENPRRVKKKEAEEVLQASSSLRDLLQSPLRLEARAPDPGSC